ncbi:hypothetical protein V8C35DRAFT_317340 [Trichoderma chlorosporum]
MDDQTDEATRQLIISLQLQDVEALIKGKHGPGDTPPDHEVAAMLYKNELLNLETFYSDRDLSHCLNECLNFTDVRADQDCQQDRQQDRQQGRRQGRRQRRQQRRQYVTGVLDSATSVAPSGSHVDVDNGLLYARCRLIW